MEESRRPILINELDEVEEEMMNDKGSVETDGEPLLGKIETEELDDLEQKIVEEMKKLSKKLGGDSTSEVSSQQPDNEIPRLKIWSGIPGTGKSFQLQKFVNSMVTDLNEDVFRTVFHPEYSMYDFVGQIRPKQSADGKNIDYPFEPGPFTRALKRSWDVKVAGKTDRIFLVIEELNRGNAAAIFGEIFQLLDFAENGESQYGIIQKDIANILDIDEDKEIKLPANIHIYATMNISDQNVFALDTAFLRRWDREYVFADKWEGACKTWEVTLPNNKTILWQSFAETVNDWLIQNAHEIGINHPEDKRLGPWFVDQRTCNQPLLFANKLLTYLWTNVFTFTMARRRVFSSELKAMTLENVLHKFIREGLGVFSIDLLNIFETKTSSVAGEQDETIEQTDKTNADEVLDDISKDEEMLDDEDLDFGEEGRKDVDPL